MHYAFGRTPKQSLIAQRGAVGPQAADESSAPAALGVCSICRDPVEDGISASCSHAFCRLCVTEYLANSIGASKCPVCTRPLTIDLLAPNFTPTNPPVPLLTASPSKPSRGATAGTSTAGAYTSGGGTLRIKKSSLLSRIKVDAFQSSTKVEALRQEIDAMLRYDASAKCIVFSQFTSMLDICHFRLQQVRSIPDRPLCPPVHRILALHVHACNVPLPPQAGAFRWTFHS